MNPASRTGWCRRRQCRRALSLHFADGRRGDFDCDDDGRGQDVRVRKEEVLDCLRVSGRWTCERGVASLVSFWTRSTNLPRGYPEAGAQMSTLSCLTVSASRKKVYLPERVSQTVASSTYLCSTRSFNRVENEAVIDSRHSELVADGRSVDRHIPPLLGSLHGDRPPRQARRVKNARDALPK